MCIQLFNKFDFTLPVFEFCLLCRILNWYWSQWYNNSQKPFGLCWNAHYLSSYDHNTSLPSWRGQQHQIMKFNLEIYDRWWFCAFCHRRSHCYVTNKDLTWLHFWCVSDCELFVFELLEDENLSESVQETRKVLLNNFRIVHARYDFTSRIFKGVYTLNALNTVCEIALE